MNEKNILVLGLGNDILTDDGIGPRIARDLSKIYKRPDIIFNYASCGGLEIMECIKEYGKVIFIDAIRSANGKPGEVYHFTTSEFRETSNISSLHDINFLTALKMGEILDIDLPSDLHIIAVEINSDLEFSEELSAELKKEYPVILEKVKLLVQECLA